MRVAGPPVGELPRQPARAAGAAPPLPTRADGRPTATAATGIARAADRRHAARAPARHRDQPDPGARPGCAGTWSRVALRAPLFNLELHGIDLADAEADEIPPALVARQPDLRRPLAHKLAALDETLAAARAAGARFVTLRGLRQRLRRRQRGAAR